MARESDLRVARILAEVSSSARALCLNAPEGSDFEPIVEAWLSARPALTPADPRDPAVVTFLADTGSSLEDPLIERHPGALVFRTQQAGVNGHDVQRLLDALLEARIVFILTVTASEVQSTEALYLRDDTVILFPESLYYTTSELTDMLGDAEPGAPVLSCHQRLARSGADLASSGRRSGVFRLPPHAGLCPGDGALGEYSTSGRSRGDLSTGLHPALQSHRV